ncbi:hypothetical protein AB1N83_010954 [Pleurotus pulmonarius]
MISAIRYTVKGDPLLARHFPNDPFARGSGFMWIPNRVHHDVNLGPCCVCGRRIRVLINTEEKVHHVASDSISGYNARYTKDVRRSRGGMCLLGLGIESPERFTPGRSFLCNTSVVGIFATWPWPTVKGPGQVNVDPTSLFVSQCGCIVLAFI